mmetsp:Transcript_30461/g.63726  ORF Transcript_30461/g.63726 Transcript_30461/m.63726 type:complete len:200 (-) Transcript_30461:189-788(-)
MSFLGRLLGLTRRRITGRRGRGSSTIAITIAIIITVTAATSTGTIPIALANDGILPILLHNPPIRLVKLLQTQFHPIQGPPLRGLELLERGLVRQALCHVILQIAQHAHEESGDAAVVLEYLLRFDHGLGQRFEFLHERFVIGIFEGVAEGGHVGFERFEGARAGRFYHADAFLRVGIAVHNPSVIASPRGGGGRIGRR